VRSQEARTISLAPTLDYSEREVSREEHSSDGDQLDNYLSNNTASNIVKINDKPVFLQRHQKLRVGRKPELLLRCLL